MHKSAQYGGDEWSTSSKKVHDIDHESWLYAAVGIQMSYWKIIFRPKMCLFHEYMSP